MFNWLLKLCDAVFPERNDHRIVRQLDIVDFKKLVSPIATDNFIYLLPFQETRVRALIHEAKFHHNEKAWVVLGEILATYLKHTSPYAIIIPLPLSKVRQRERGYNQVEMIAKESLKSLVGRKIHTEIIIRQKHTAPQTSLARQERLENMQNAFKVRGGISLTNKDVIVIDDVATTGATLKAAEASLRPHNPSSITLLAIAH